MIYLRLLPFLFFGLLPMICPAQEEQKETIELTVSHPLALEEKIKIIQQFNFILNDLEQMLELETDSTAFSSNIQNAERLSSAIRERLENQEGQINIRYLKALENLMRSAKEQLNEVEKPLSQKIDRLVKAKHQLDSIKNDPILSNLKSDDINLPAYNTSLLELRKKINSVERKLNALRIENADFQNKLGLLSLESKYLSDKLLKEKRSLERNLTQKETNYLWEKKALPNPSKLADVFKESWKFNQIIISRYIMNHLGMSIFLLTLVLAIYYWTNNNLNTIKSQKEFASIILGRTTYTPHFPFFASLLVVTVLAPLFYTYPPISILAALLFLSVSISGILLTKRISGSPYRIWGVLYFLFIFSLLSNLYWEIAYQERWHLLILGLLSIGMTYKIKSDSKNSGEKLPKYLPAIANLFIAFQTAAILANVLGRFSLAKLLSLSATLSMMHALCLLIFITIIKEMIYLQIEVSQKNESDFTSLIDFEDIQKRLTKLFAYLAIGIWGYYFLESLSVLDFILDKTSDFLNQPRSIMNASFNFGQIAVFILVVYVASFLANSIAYVAAIKDQQSALNRTKRLGSKILLIRLTILIIGFLIAIAASGIPLDKIAIVLGALSVGIGFGLQTIVNNLVSGIILAFERPVQIGDVIQVGPVEGVVSEIGIRASKIKNYEGAEVIIPNGDLLSQHLTNWTLSDKKRRVELTIGVSYHTDMELASDLIKEALDTDGIIKIPAPRVLMQTFADSSVNFRILFWVEDIDTMISVRDRVMRSIFASFKANNIEIPFPQRDLHVKSFPGNREVDLSIKKENNQGENPL